MLSTMIFKDTYTDSELITLTSKDTVFVRCYGPRGAVFDESAHLTGILKDGLMFTTKSGVTVKTDFDGHTVGESFKEHYFMSFDDMIGY